MVERAKRLVSIFRRSPGHEALKLASLLEAPMVHLLATDGNHSSARSKHSAG
jgi:hypothetical protein